MFRDRQPQVELQLRELCTPDQEAALLANDIQIGFLHPPIHSRLQTQDILAESMVLALPENHPLAAQTTLSIKDLASESFILFPRDVGPYLYSRILLLCAQAGFSPKVAQEVTPQPTMIGLVAAGLGVAFVSESLQSISRPGVIYRKLQEETPMLQLAIAWNNESKSSILANFLHTIQDWPALTI
ncbi:MAG: LysR family substrate-binding domain-containing protein, partial [Cyanobacteria bacterium P01_H01_bin.121]